MTFLTWKQWCIPQPGLYHRLFYLVAGTIHALGVSIKASLVLTLATFLAAGGLGMRRLVRSLATDRWVSALAGLAFMGATYTTTAPYGRAGNLYKQILLSNGGVFRLTSGSFNNNVPSSTNTAAGVILNIGTGGGVFDVASGATLIVDDGTGTGTGSGTGGTGGSL